MKERLLGDLADTAMGLVGAAILAWAYTWSPVIALSFVGFHIGVMTMRIARGYIPRRAVRGSKGGHT